MEKRLLFINHREEEIKGFLEAMPEELKIDTADNGIDAALLMKKNTYGVIVVDMELKGYDGEQLIKFMNKVYPDTVCIVYTVAITQGQLSFLLNERNVFHVFLSPANFREEFYQMIEEGFVLYGVNTVNNQEADELEEKYQKREKSLEEKSLVLEQQKKERQQFLQFSKNLTEESLRIYGKNVEEKEMLSRYEQEVLHKAQEVLEHSCHGFEEMEEMLCQEFIKGNEKREMHFYTPQYMVQGIPDSFYESVYTVLWGLLRYFSAISETYTMSVRVEFESSRRAVIMLIVTLPSGTWEEYRQKPVYEHFKKLTQYVAESLMDSYMRVINDDLISYRLELDLDEKKL